MSRNSVVIVLVLTLLTGCGDHEHETHHHMQHSHTHHDGHVLEPIALTHYTKETELFVEFEPFVVNRPSTFLAHFTTLSDFKPVAEAKVHACLEYLKGKKECFSVEGTQFAGIFKPVAVPKYSGEVMLHITIKLENKKIVHSLGNYKVYASINHVHHEKHKHEEGGSEISYLKEQQWKVDFATEVVKKRPIRQASSTFVETQLPYNAQQSVSAPLSGIVVSASGMEVGSVVKSGDTVAYIVPALAHGEDTATLQFEYTRAHATLKLAKSENERIKKLYEQKAISLKRVEESKQSYEIAKAALASIEKKLLRLNPTGGDNGVALKSYIEGNIVDMHKFNGSYVHSGELLMQIADTSNIWLKAGIPQSEIDFIGKPTGIELIKTENQQVFHRGETAKLVYFSKLIDPKTRKAYAIFEVDNQKAHLRAGATFAAKVYTDKVREVVTVPQSAIISDNGEPIVFVQTGGESFERRLIEIGVRDSGNVEIHSGVETGERVVTKGAYRVMLSTLAPASVGHGHAH
jgi:RND family efflux transporter MFP subunit